MANWMQTWQELASVLQQWPLDRWIQVAQVFGMLLAVAVAYRQLSLLRRQLRDNQVKERRDRTLRYSIVSSPELGKARDAIDRLLPPQDGKPLPTADIQAAMKKNADLSGHLLGLLAHWENLALTVAAGAADEDVAFEMVGSVLVDSVGRLENYIRTCQAERPRRYIYLLRLAERWRGRMARDGARMAFAF